MSVTPEMVDKLSPLALGVYCQMVLRVRRGRVCNIGWVATAFCGGDLDAAWTVIDALDEVGLICSPSTYLALKCVDPDELRRIARAEAQAREYERARERLAADPDSASRTLLKYTGEEWSASWPVSDEAGPQRACDVIYFCWDSDDRLAYIGQTRYFHGRMARHAKARISLVWARLRVFETAQSHGLVDLEAEEILRHRPYRNGEVQGTAQRRRWHSFELAPVPVQEPAAVEDAS